MKRFYHPDALISRKAIADRLTAQPIMMIKSIGFNRVYWVIKFYAELSPIAREGVTLLGRYTGADGGKVYLAADLYENLARIDKFETHLVKGIDHFIIKSGYVAPEETLPCDCAGYDAPIVTELDVKEAGINSLIWAGGYKFNFSWIHLPVLDGDGFPIQQRGVSAYPGLYFLGLPWLHTPISGLLLGVGEDAAYIASQIAGNK